MVAEGHRFGKDFEMDLLPIGLKLERIENSFPIGTEDACRGVDSIRHCESEYDVS